jgi:hypothetical protein
MDITDHPVYRPIMHSVTKMRSDVYHLQLKCHACTHTHTHTNIYIKVRIFHISVTVTLFVENPQYYLISNLELKMYLHFCFVIILLFDYICS